MPAQQTQHGAGQTPAVRRPIDTIKTANAANFRKPKTLRDTQTLRQSANATARARAANAAWSRTDTGGAQTP